MKRTFVNYPDVVSINELMTMFNIGKKTAYSLLHTREIKSIKVGRQYRLPKRFIIEYLQCS
ncbi:MAG: helix-turn-helix domain-containing protein [Acutalibacteraceae bacterium]|nr:MAG TPA: helix-turn-helix domain protein [Caudoviricetes sp.]